VVRATIARRRIRRLRELDHEIRDLAGQLGTRVAATRTRLTGLVGIGPILAARILGEVGDIHRFATADHFAAANGTAPIPVASGRTDRHRLNRGGNRRLNYALHCMALTQATWEPRAVAYLAASRLKARPGEKPCAASSGGYPTSCSPPCAPDPAHRSTPQPPELDHRSSTAWSNGSSAP
jgi:transposase